MNPLLSPEQFDQEQQDRALLNEAQRLLVKKIIRQSTKDDDLTDAQVRIYSTAIANFQKIALARDRIDLGRRRLDANYNITRAKCDTQLDVARIRAEAANAKRRPDHPQVDEDDPLAPFGRKKDATPYTEAEFDQSLNEAIRDIWGLKPVNPNSYMPWEKRPDPDGPPDIADSAALRAPTASEGSDREKPSDPACRFADRTSPDVPTSRAPSPSRDPFVSSLPAVAGNSSFAITTEPSSSRTETAPARYPSEDG